MGSSLNDINHLEDRTYNAANVLNEYLDAIGKGQYVVLTAEKDKRGNQTLKIYKTKWWIVAAFVSLFSGGISGDAVKKELNRWNVSIINDANKQLKQLGQKEAWNLNDEDANTLENALQGIKQIMNRLILNTQRFLQAQVADEKTADDIRKYGGQLIQQMRRISNTIDDFIFGPLADRRALDKLKRELETRGELNNYEDMIAFLSEHIDRIPQERAKQIYKDLRERIAVQLRGIERESQEVAALSLPTHAQIEERFNRIRQIANPLITLSASVQEDSQALKSLQTRIVILLSQVKEASEISSQLDGGTLEQRVRHLGRLANLYEDLPAPLQPQFRGLIIETLNRISESMGRELESEKDIDILRTSSTRANALLADIEQIARQIQPDIADVWLARIRQTIRLTLRGIDRTVVSLDENKKFLDQAVAEIGSSSQKHAKLLSLLEHMKVMGDHINHPYLQPHIARISQLVTEEVDHISQAIQQIQIPGDKNDDQAWRQFQEAIAQQQAALDALRQAVNGLPLSDQVRSAITLAQQAIDNLKQRVQDTGIELIATIGSISLITPTSVGNTIPARYQQLSGLVTPLSPTFISYLTEEHREGIASARTNLSTYRETAYKLMDAAVRSKKDAINAAIAKMQPEIEEARPTLKALIERQSSSRNRTEELRKALSGRVGRLSERINKSLTEILKANAEDLERTTGLDDLIKEYQDKCIVNRNKFEADRRTADSTLLTTPTAALAARTEALTKEIDFASHVIKELEEVRTYIEATKSLARNRIATQAILQRRRALDAQLTQVAAAEHLLQDQTEQNFGAAYASALRVSSLQV